MFAVHYWRGLIGVCGKGGALWFTFIQLEAGSWNYPVDGFLCINKDEDCTRIFYVD